MNVLLHADTGATAEGGVNTCVKNLGRELAGLGVAVEYLFGTDPTHQSYTYLDGIPKALRLYDVGLGALRLRAVLHRLADRYDIVHAHGSNAIFDAVVATHLLGSRATYRLVATLHGTDLGTFHQLRQDLQLGREHYTLKTLALLVHFGLASRKERYAYTHIDGLLARSRGVAAEAARWFGVNAHPICPGTDSTIFQPLDDPTSRRALRRSLGLLDQELAVLAIGKPSWKGIRYLAEAVQRAGAPFRLVTVGAGPEISGPHAIALPMVPHDDLPALYAACDIFCLPSTYEAFGLVLLDAMACGLPCVASDSSGGKELIRDDDNGLLVRRRDVDALAAALLRLGDATLRARLGASARQTARTLTWRREAELTLSWYQQQLAASRQHERGTHDA